MVVFVFSVMFVLMVNHVCIDGWLYLCSQSFVLMVVRRLCLGHILVLTAGRTICGVDR